MITAKRFRRKLHSTLLTSILLSSMFIISLLTFVQPTWSPVPWWNTQWNFRKQITLNHTMVETDLVNFPVLIDILDNDLRAKAQFDGDDIVFIDANNNILNHEIELYDSTSGHLVAWVKIPLLSFTVDANLYMYYGNPSATNQQNSSAVWDSNFLMVQHLEEKYGTRYDSTANGNSAIPSSSVGKDLSGKIDGADKFSANGYDRVPQGFLPGSALTVELWLKPSSYSSTIWTKFINTGPTTTTGISGGQTSLKADTWYLGISWDSGGKRFNTGDIRSGYAWNHIAVTWNGTYSVAYVNGAKIKESAISGSPDWAGKPLYLGSNYYSGERFNGTIDEVRISSLARPAAWIKTSYNNQKDPTTFYTRGNEESYSYAPVILNETPSNEATDVYTNPTLSIRAVDPDGQNMTIIFREKVFNTWIDLKTYQNVQDGTYNATSTNMKNLGTTYYWSVHVTDGETWTNKTLSFTTTTKILTAKWVAQGVPSGVSGVLTADVNGDGLEEVFYAGKGGVVALRGTDGGIIWRVNDSSVGDTAQPQMADLNRDGILEIVVPRETPAGLLVLHANNGSVYWNITGLGKEMYSSPVIFDIDGNGYPTIFVASTDIYKGLSGSGRITSLSYDGKILHQTFSWRPCSGGLSIADTDADGKFELYMGDRYMYLNSTEYGDNDYGKGVQSYWAKNLTLRWYRSDFFLSSHIPMLADVNKDGVLDVIVGDMNGGVAVLNSKDGSIIKATQGIPDRAPVHYQPSVYDIDGDGNLELIMADPHDFTSDEIVVWDLVKWQVDTKMYLGKSYYGPQVADVTGDGVMEIIVANYKSIFIIDKTYRIIEGITGLAGEVNYGGEVRNIDGIVGLTGTLNYAVVQDIDGDGYNELIISAQGGYIYAFDTPARRPNPRPRTEVQFYSEFRLGVAEYVQPQGGPAPVISSPNPSNLATDVPVSLSELRFTLTDYQRNLMNYTVTTYPNIGSISATNKGNGRYNLSISNLQYSTTYTWTVTATDGTNWTSKTYMFTTQTFFPWWNKTWQYRKAITIDHNKVNADLQNFPLLIDIIDNDLASKAKPDGSDIAFTDSNGVKLNHEIELYNNNTGRIVAWVNVPILSSTTDTKLYMYYGYANSTDQQNRSAVWDSNFVMVQHMEEPSGTRYDSTSYGNNAIPSGVVGKDPAGKIDGADSFNGDGYETIQQGFLPTNAITVELWLNPTSYSSTVWRKHINTGPSTTTGITGGQTSLTSDLWSLTLTWDGKTKAFGTRGQPSGFNWIHLVVTWTGSYAYAYYNGVKIREEAVTGIPDWAGKPLYLGSNYYGGERFDGAIDEVRISNIARSAAWIQTSYNNQKDPKTFSTIEAEETIPEAPIVFAPSPPDKAINISPSLSGLSFNITDYQGDQMNYTVTTYPNIGSDIRLNVSSSRFTVPVSSLQHFKTYMWTVSVTDGTHWTNITFSFSTYPSEPPTQDYPILVLGEVGSIIGYNQSTYDPDGDRVTNIYNWYRNNTSLTNLLLPFDTNTSTTAKDYSGYNNNGIIVRGATWTSNGKVGGAYTFDRGFIEIPGTNTLDGGGQWSEITVEHWIYLTASQSGTRTIARIPSYEIGISGNKIFTGIWIATGNPMKSGYNRVTYDTPLNLTTWYHVAFTYKSGVGLTLYVNGFAVATKPVSGNIQPSGTINPLYIGWFDYFKGTIDEVRIYPRSLSPLQIQQRYLETKDGLSNSSTIVSPETSTGDVWRCEVTPNDGYHDGTTKSSNTITIGVNNKPTAKDLTITPITPTTPNTNNNLTASYTYFDPDGDPENKSATEIRWYKNGVLQPELNNTLIVSYNLTTKDDIWYFTVRPSDGKEYGTLQTSAPVLIQNSPPTIDSYFPLADPTISEEESQEFNITYSDIDGNNITVQWYLNGTPTVSTDSYTFEANYTSAGTYNVTVIISDGVGQGSHEWALFVNNVNRPPVALFTESAETVYMGVSLTFNASDSYDPDGPIASYFWNFGDGKNATGVIVSHAYSVNGTFTVTLTVTDYEGASNSTSATKTVLWNDIPVASFTESAETVPTGEIIYFNASSSYDLDGSIVSYFWDFGDGTNATGITVSHSYAENGTYTVTLTVTDDDGATSTATATKIVLNTPPVALFTESATTAYTGEVIYFNASASYDQDGYILSYFWDFGDGSNAAGVIVEHAYADNGTYVVTLTVTDNDGATASSNSTKTVQNRPPTALFTESADVVFTSETVTFNASSSYDSDGTIVSFYWDFGDGTNATGVIVDHAYADNGTYTVTLTVIDDDNATDTKAAVKTILNKPPIADFTESSETVYTGETITFNASSSYDPDGSIISYYWDFGDGTNATGVIVEHAYADTGNYTVTLTVTDDDGANATASAIKNVLNSPPEITSWYPSNNPTINETQSQIFNVTCFDIDGDPLNISWYVYYSNGTLKDQGTGESYTFYAQEGSAGTYTVIVKVSDGETETSRQWTLSVEQLP